MKLVTNQTKKESFLYDNNKIVNLKVAYSFIKNNKKSWNFKNDKINIQEYSYTDSLLDKLLGKKHLEY